MTPRIPQCSPAASCQAHQAGIEAAVARVLASGWFILGPEVAAFEREFAAFLGAAGCAGAASGTDALELALRACGVGAGDAVLTVSHTAVATIAAIERAQAVPVLVDVDPATCTMDPQSLVQTIAAYERQARPGRPPLKAVVPVHLYGHPADMPAILAAAQERGLRVVEDCAQAHGALWGGRAAGTWGHAAAFSFYPTKNLGALGDGGAVVSSDPAVIERARLLRQYGWRERYISQEPGLNSRLDELQAAVLRVKLPSLAAENERRRALAALYSAGLAGAPVQLPVARPEARHVFHQYVIALDGRDALQAALRAEGIGTLVHYPVPAHLQPAYAGRLFTGDAGLPVTEAAARRVLSLPMHPHLEDEQVREVCQAVLRLARGKGADRC